MGILGNITDPFTPGATLEEIGSDFSRSLPFNSPSGVGIWECREWIKDCNLFEYGEGNERQDDCDVV
jgi:hypothetical protein